MSREIRPRAVLPDCQIAVCYSQGYQPEKNANSYHSSFQIIPWLLKALYRDVAGRDRNLTRDFNVRFVSLDAGMEAASTPGPHLLTMHTL